VIEERIYADFAAGPVGQPFVERLLRTSATSAETVRVAEYLDGLGGVTRRVAESDSGYMGVVTVRDHADRTTTETDRVACGSDPHCLAIDAATAPGTRIVYDALGRATRVDSPEGVELALYGRTARTSLAGGTPAFDTALLKDVGGRLKQRVYDGERVAWVDTCTNTVAAEATSLAGVPCSAPESTGYGYLATGRLGRIRDPGGTELVYGYDLLGQVTTVSDPSGGTTILTYLEPGLVETVTNARSQVTRIGYDSLDRPEYVDRTDLQGNPIEPRVVISYDWRTRQRSRVGPEGNAWWVQHAYDSLGRESQRKVAVAGTPTLVTDFAYDLLDRPTQILYPDGLDVRYAYAGAYLSGVWERAANGSTQWLVSGIDYDAVGRPWRMTERPGVVGFDYEPGAERLARLWFEKAGTAVRELDLEYEYAGGRIAEIVDHHVLAGAEDVVASARLTYDHDNRLASFYSAQRDATDGAGSGLRYYDHDVRGNLTLKDGTTPTSPPNQVYGNPARPHWLTAAHGSSEYSYDADGNQTRRPGQALGYDVAGRLTCVGTTASGSCDLAAFTYDLDGTLLARAAGGSEEVWVGDLFRFEQAGSRATSYVWALGRLVATRAKSSVTPRAAGSRPAAGLAPGPPWLLAGFGALAGAGLVILAVRAGVPAQLRRRPVPGGIALLVVGSLLPGVHALAGTPPPPSGTWRWFFSDHLGSAQLVTNDAGSPVARRIFDPFGGVVDAWTTGEATEQRFAGHRQDPGVGLTFMGARWYDPVTGRFASVDPVVQDAFDPAASHPYAYARNDPVQYVDPTGAFAIGPLVFLAGQILAALAAESPLLAAAAAGTTFLGTGITVHQTFNQVVASTAEQTAAPPPPGSGPTAPGGTHTTARHDCGGDACPHPESQSDAPLEQPIFFDPVDMVAGAIAGGIVLGPPGVIGGGILGGLAKGGLRAAAREAPEIGQKVFRVWGDEAGAWGKSWTRVDPRSTPDYRNAAGLPRQNTGRFVSEGRLRSTEGVQARGALSLEGKSGGLDELVVPDPRRQIELEGVFGVNPEY
jgi:RHS repeat-associated protein